MKVIESQRVDFVTGQNMPPEDINAVLLYGLEALDDVAQKRFQRSPLPLPFVTDVGAAYTQASNVEVRTYRFTCPVTCVVERAFLHANMTSNAETVWNIVTAAGAVPAGATVPWLSTKGAVVFDNTALVGAVSADGVIASAANDVEDNNPDRVLLVAGAEYKITVSSPTAGNFTLERADIILHVITDRWQQGANTDSPIFLPTLNRDGDLDDTAVNLTDTLAAFNVAVATLATHLEAPAPLLFVRHGLLSGTGANIRNFTIPLADPNRSKCRVTKIYGYAFVAGACTIKFILKNAAGVTQAEVDVVCAGAGFFSSGALAAGALPASLVGIAGDPAVGANDWTLEMQNTSAVNDGTKVYSLVWVSRA